MRAYYYDNLPGDQRLAHDYIPSKPVSQATLEALGVNYWRISVEGYEEEINTIAAANGYKNRDTINVTKEGLGDSYEAKIRSFFHEYDLPLDAGQNALNQLSRHLHEDEEIRYILSGSGFFDVREASSDAWIRIGVEPGDLLVIPAGIYHRFTLDEKDNIKALRLFKDEPKWIPYNRSKETDANSYRIDYLKKVGVEA